jgi:alkylation response protein AidB-like acyl-CoA dehydrogenase
MPVTDDERTLLLETVRAIARERVSPLAEEIDRESRFPHEWRSAFADAGIFALPFAAEHGGTDTGSLLLLQAIEELAKVDGTAALMLSLQELAALPIKLAGSREQRSLYLPRLARGEILGGYALTEPQAGSDAAALSTTARRDGDAWVLDGTKRFISNAGVAAFYTVFARTDPDPAAGARGVSAFLVEVGDPGLSMGRLERKMGIRGSTTGDVILADCRIPADRILGAPGSGFGLAMRVLDRSRTGIGAQAIGLAQGAIDHAAAYARQREQFGRPIAAQQAIQFLLADMQTRTDAARLLLHQAGRLIDEGATDPRFTRISAQAKLLCSDVAMDVTTDAVQILGGYGYTSEYPLERMMRDAKVCQIYEGTNQILRLIIARELLAGR